MRRSRRSLTYLTLALAMTLVVTATVAFAATPKTGKALRAALPEPDAKKDLTGTREFVGLNRAGKVALAVVVHRSGAAVAFLCDGQNTWRVFVGKVKRNRLNLKGPRGARLVGRIRGTRLTARVTGRGLSAQAAQADIGFALKRAVEGAGLRRLVTMFDGASVEALWVTTNNGVIKGAGFKPNATTPVGSTNTTSSNTSEQGEANPGPETGSDPQATGLITKLRCASIVLKFSKVSADVINGTGSGTLQQQQQLQDRFGALGCFDQGFAL